MDPSVPSTGLTSLFQCPVCLQPFTDPRMLPTCLHTLCCRCLETYLSVSGQRTCPICRVPFQAPENGADGFPKNFFVTICKEFLISGSNGETQKFPGDIKRTGVKCCNAEDEDDCSKPEDFCEDCCEYFCSDCSKAHRKSKTSRGHEMLKAEEATDELLARCSSKRQVPRCQVHQKKLKLYCSTCLCAVCSLCCHVGHQSHELEEIHKVDEKTQSQLHHYVTRLQTMIAETKTQKGQVELKQKEYASAVSSATQTAQTVFTEMSKMLEQKARQIQQTIEGKSQDVDSAAAARNKNLDLNMELMESLLSFVEYLVDKGSVFNRLASMADVRSRLKRLSSNPVDAKPLTASPKSHDLLIEQLDGLVLKEELKLQEPGDSKEPRILKVIIQCQLQRDKDATEEEAGDEYQTLTIKNDDYDSYSKFSRDTKLQSRPLKSTSSPQTRAGGQLTRRPDSAPSSAASKSSLQRASKEPEPVGSEQQVVPVRSLRQSQKLINQSIRQPRYQTERRQPPQKTQKSDDNLDDNWTMR